MRRDCLVGQTVERSLVFPHFFKNISSSVSKADKCLESAEWANVYPVCPVMKVTIAQGSFMRRYSMILNRKYLDQFLRIHMQPENTELFPLSAIRLQLHSLNLWQQSAGFNNTDDFLKVVVNCISRYLDRHKDIFIQDHPGVFYLASLNSSVSRTTKLVVDLHAALIDLIDGNAHTMVRVSSRSAIFDHCEVVEHWLDCLDLVDRGIPYETCHGSVPILVYR